MDYTRILSPINKVKDLDVNPEGVERRIYNIEKEIKFELPEAYKDMLKSCDGGRLRSVYVPCKKKDGKVFYHYIDIIYGVLQEFWSIQRAHKQNNELILDNGFSDFVFDFLTFAYETGQVSKFKEEGALPNYIDSEEPDEDQIICFYNDFNLYIDKLDAIIDKLEYSDNRSRNARIVFGYRMIRFFKLSVEFATDDGHGNYHLYYGEGNISEPSVWYAYDLDYQYKVAPNFKEFIKTLVVDRRVVCFGISEINDEICLFINKLLVSVFNIQTSVTIDSISDSVINSNKEYSITPNEKVWIRVRPNEYNDGSGFNEVLYKDYRFILKVGSSRRDGDKNHIIFKEEYEEKILDVFKENNFSGLKLLYTLGVHNLLEEIAKSDAK